MSGEMEAFAKQVVMNLRESGFTSYFAGGCVRDMLLDVTPKDYDVATNAEPEQVRRVFGRKRTIAVGQSFGVITVLGPKPHQVEVATFRNDGAYTDGRRPDTVTFSSPEEDAKRRDFTINGMFFDPIDEQIIDYVGGQQDLQSKVISAIGDPHERINEDRLRMLRAVRFAATYGFEISPATMSAIQQLHDKISSVSQERITHELKRMLQKQSSRRPSMTLLRESLLLAPILPCLNDSARDATQWTRALNIVEHLQDNNSALVLAALFLVAAKLDHKQVSNQSRQLKLSNEERKSIEWIAKHYQTLDRAQELKFSELQPLLIAPNAIFALDLLDAIHAADDTPNTGVATCSKYLALPAEQLNPQPFVTGGDLVAAGIEPGPQFADLLRRARAAQLDGEVTSKEAAIKLLHLGDDI